MGESISAVGIAVTATMGGGVLACEPPLPLLLLLSKTSGLICRGDGWMFPFPLFSLPLPLLLPLSEAESRWLGLWERDRERWRREYLWMPQRSKRDLYARVLERWAGEVVRYG